MSRIFVSSVGAISCAGTSIEDFWEGINKTNHRYDAISLPVALPQNVDSRIARRMDRFSRMALCVSKLTLNEEYLQQAGLDKIRVGTVFHTSYGPTNSTIKFIEQIEQNDLDLVSPTVFTSTVHNSAIGHTCMNLNLKGASTMLLGSNAIAYAAELIKNKKADAVLCVGLEEYCEELAVSYQQKGSISKEPDFLCQPFDVNRSGSRMTEGAGAIFLQDERALHNNPDGILSEILGYSSLISYSNPIINDGELRPEDFAEVMRVALRQASLDIEHIDGILMSAGGGMSTDRIEAEAVHQVFGKRAPSIPVASIKGAIGETMGSSLILNSIAASLGLVHNVMPLTSGCEAPDPEFNLDIVHREVRPGNYKYILVNGFDVNGCLSSVVLGSVWR